VTIHRTAARDAELEAWLDGIKAQQSGDALYAELWLANVEAKAIKDPRSSAYDAAHQRINAIIGRIEAL
jgi:hypothetical protein